jgi:hypothetical protein
MDANKTSIEHPTVEEGPKLALNNRRDFMLPLPLRCQKRLQFFRHHGVQQTLLRGARLID